MSTRKTPGVYIVENNAFPNSVIEVATAVPAFIGYTKIAQDGKKSLHKKPWRISSLAEFMEYFGGEPDSIFSFTETTDKALKNTGTLIALNGDTSKFYSVARKDSFNLYYNMKLFFANGGGSCYIVSVGTYADDFSGNALAGGIDILSKEREPTMVVVPEAVNTATTQACYDIQTAVVKHCGQNKNRIAILDVYNGNKARTDTAAGDVVAKFREKIGTEFLNYAAAYYPWLNTSVVSESEITFRNIDEKNLGDFKTVVKSHSPNLAVYIDAIGTSTDKKLLDTAHKVLCDQCPLYAAIVKEMLHQVNLLPASAAMAGIFTQTDLTKEVWNAPANVGLANVISTSVNISHADQEDLNVPMDGKAINAIRYFTGEGIKVWGARTLDGNSADWRYISVRRTMIMLEESIKNVARAFVFEPNVANTWVIVRSTISNFLNGIWKRGGLAGAVPEDAYSVHIGLGNTMTADDVLEGIMRITVLVAVSRPAEYIEITFIQQMQKS